MAAPRPSGPPRDLRRSVRHPLFGHVPVLSAADGGAPGAVPTYRFDPDYRPPLPAGAVRGDPRRQIFCCDVPRYFYVDLDRTCRDCGERFVFSAREQKLWYETLGFRLDATAVRCLPCRRRFRATRGVVRAVSDASRALADSPHHPPAVLAYARAAVAHQERFGHAPLDAALAALRALARSGAGLLEALYWEGRCHEAAGRARRAIASYGRFAAEAASSRRLAVLRRDAARRRTLLEETSA